METSVDFVEEEMLVERGLTRRGYDSMPDVEQERMLGQYMAKQCLTRWQNYANWRRFKDKEG